MGTYIEGVKRRSVDQADILQRAGSWYWSRCAVSGLTTTPAVSWPMTTDDRPPLDLDQGELAKLERRVVAAAKNTQCARAVRKSDAA